VDIEIGRARTLTVGRLDTTRDFLDIEDAVRAIWIVSQKGKSGDVYNISSGIGTPILKVLEVLKSLARTKVLTEGSDEENRKLDLPVVIGNNQKLKMLGWTPTIPLNNSLSRILDYWRTHT
jgi:GDP-4-dehydro-6-deoxy-D-mannose reductase